MRRFIMYITYILSCCINVYAWEYDGWSYTAEDYYLSKMLTITGSTIERTVMNIPQELKYGGHYYPVKYIESDAFNNDSKLQNVTYVSIPKYKYEGVGVVFQSGAFRGLKNLRVVDIYSTHNSIDRDSFRDCESLKKVRFNPELVYIYHNAFDGCAIEFLNLPSGLQYIYSYAFANNGTSLKFYQPGINVREINEYAFSGTHIKYLALKNTAPTISSFAFDTSRHPNIIFCDNKPNLSAKSFCGGSNDINTNYPEAIYCRSLTPPTSAANAFSDGAKKNTILYIPKGSFEAYWRATGWKDFNKIQEIDFVETTQLSIEKTVNVALDSEVPLPIESNEDRTIKDFVYVIEDSTIVNINSHGVAKGLKIGSTNVDIYSVDGSNLKESCTLRVNYPDITSFQLNPTEVRLGPGGNAEIEVLVEPNNTNKKVTWSSGDTDIAAVREENGKGFILARNGGETHITATSVLNPEIFAKCKVTVIDWLGIEPGDVNGDRVIDEADIVALGDILIGKTPQNPPSDVNEDGITNMDDYYLLIQFILNIDK